MIIIRQRKGNETYFNVDIEEIEADSKSDEDETDEELAGIGVITKWVERDDYGPLAMALCMAILTGCSQPAQLIIFR